MQHYLHAISQQRSQICYVQKNLLYSSEAAAPVIISTSSPVMTACLVRLNRIWNLLIMSPAFFEALSIALRRADCSQAWPSARACYCYVSTVRVLVGSLLRG